MTDKAQNEAIAQVLKVVREPDPEYPDGYCFADVIYPLDEYPSFTAELNAMHWAEKTMGGDARGNYPTYLFEVVCRTSSKEQADFNKFHPDSWAIQATAAQRAEAFLRTLNLWDDTK